MSFLSCSLMPSLSALCVTLCVCCCWQTHIVDSKSIYTIYSQFRSGICLCLQQSSGKAYLLFFKQMQSSIFLPKRALHKLQPSIHMPVWVSAQWKKNPQKNLNLYVLFCLFFYLSIRKTQNSSHNKVSKLV